MTMTDERPVTSAERITAGEWSVRGENVADMVAAIRGMATVANDPARKYDVIAFTVAYDGSCHMAVTDSYRAIRVTFPAGSILRGSVVSGSVALPADDLAAAVKTGKPGKDDALLFRFDGTLPARITYRVGGSGSSRDVFTRDVPAHLTPGGFDRLIPEPTFDGGRFDVGRFAGIGKALGVICGASRKHEPTFDVLAMSARKPCHLTATTVGGCPVDVIIMPCRK